MEPNGEHKSVKDVVENILFLANEPISLKRLAESLPHSKEEIAAAIDALTVENLDRGLKVRFISGGYILSTDPALATEIEEFYKLQKVKRLSRQSLETLAVIAYNQPITRAEIESVRGVSTTGTIQTLIERGLVKVTGQKETLGNPFLYGTTDEFLRHFGLGDIGELPQLEFETEGLTRPLKGLEESPDGEPKSDGENTRAEAEVTPIDFGFTEESAEVTINVQQKGA